MSEALNRQIAEVKRELMQRERVYPKMVEQGRMTQDLADSYTGTMMGVLATLQFLRDNEAEIRLMMRLKKEIGPEAIKFIEQAQTTFKCDSSYCVSDHLEDVE